MTEGLMKIYICKLLNQVTNEFPFLKIESKNYVTLLLTLVQHYPLFFERKHSDFTYKNTQYLKNTTIYWQKKQKLEITFEG